MSKVPSFKKNVCGKFQYWAILPHSIIFCLGTNVVSDAIGGACGNPLPEFNSVGAKDLVLGVSSHGELRSRTGRAGPRTLAGSLELHPDFPKACQCSARLHHARRRRSDCTHTIQKLYFLPHVLSSFPHNTTHLHHLPTVSTLCCNQHRSVTRHSSRCARECAIARGKIS